MRHFKYCVVLLALVSLGAMTGCGNAGDPFSVADNPLVITSAALPATLSGQAVGGDPVLGYEIPIAGGCGGPYVMEILQGSGDLPPGIGVDFDVPTTGPLAGVPRHHLVGIAMEDGTFGFTLKITDTGCIPFSTTVQAYVWPIGQGPLQIVGASPALIPVADFNASPKWNDMDALETVVYGSPLAYDLIAAGGVAPYVCSVINDPADPRDDTGLPTGLNMAVSSCSFNGTPIQVGPGGAPFVITFRVTDAVGSFTDRKLQFKIDTPPLILANADLPDGQAGVSYSDSIQPVDGVPPFGFEFVDAVPADDQNPDTTDNQYDNVDYTTSPPTVGLPGVLPVLDPLSVAGGLTLSGTGPADAGNKLPSTAAPNYPNPADTGPYSPFPPEGMYIVDGAINPGSILGKPRRTGNYTVFVHGYSTLVPNERGQHAFKPFNFDITAAPPLAMNPAFTLEGTLTPVGGPDPFPTVPEAEQTVIYNPDQGSHAPAGLEMLANGGVTEDGLFDTPHSSTLAVNPAETDGNYNWVTGPMPPELNGLEMISATGIFGTPNQAAADNLPRGGRTLFDATVSDQKLPFPAGSQTQTFGISIGPDVVIVTHSTNSLTAIATYWSYSAGEGHRFNDTTMTIKQFDGIATGPSIKVLDDATSQAATHSVPSAAGLAANANPLGALLSGSSGGDANLDLLRGVVNATGWWDDVHQLNANGARPYAHADNNGGYVYMGAFGQSYSVQKNRQPSCTAIDLPDAQGVAHDPSAGVYADGGRLYHFESNSRFGCFIVRPDAKIYVPFAYEKDGTFEGFGDGILWAKAGGSAKQNSALRTVQMTVSPDGRFGAMKLKSNVDYLYEQASTTQILVFSLTGEKVFAGGATYRIFDTNVLAATGATSPRIMFASSMALTNSHLYFLIGSAMSTGSSSSSYLYRASWQSHYLMRVPILAGLPDLLPGVGGNWTQGSGSPMQTTYHHHGPHSSTGTYLSETYTYYGYWPYHRYWHEDGMNFNETNVAPTPFRVSRNGMAVAFMAGSNYTGTFSSLVYSNYAWVDYNATGARQASGSRRHNTVGSARGYTLVRGPNEYAHWGMYCGPTPGLEIADDGDAIAFTYNTAGTVSATSSYSSSYWRSSRENVICSYTANNWGSFTEKDVTASTFTGSHRWRFGALAFTADGTGLVFWGGSPLYSATTTSYTYMQSYQSVGTMYVFALTDTNRVTSMLATTAAGNPDGAGKVYTNSSPFSPSGTSGINNRYGALVPYGGFMSKNRNFLYILNHASSSSSDATAEKLVAFNVSTVSAGSINGHSNARGFIPSNWPSRRGFLGNYYYYYYGRYPMDYGYHPHKATGAGRQIMAKDTGWVYWGVGWQYAGPYTPYQLYGAPPYQVYSYGCYGYGGIGVYGFDPDVGGPIAQINDPSLSPNSTNTRELLSFMDCARNGSRLCYVSSTQYYYQQHNAEKITEVHDLDFNSVTGVIDPNFDNSRLESSNGRAGEAFGFTPVGTTIYYAFGGSSNETSRSMHKAVLDPVTGNWDITNYTTVTGRINVLHSAR